MSHLQRLTKNNHQSKPQKTRSKFLILALKITVLLFILIVGFFYLFLVNDLATSPEKIRNLSQEIKNLQKENKKLESEITRFEAISDIQAKASNLGLVRVAKVEYLEPEEIVTVVAK